MTPDTLPPVKRLGIVALLTAALAAGVAAAATGPLVLGGGSSGSTVHAAVGRTIRIKLAANASTGYSWAVRSSGKPALRLLWTRYIEPPKTAGPPKVGAPGLYEAAFRAVAAGRGKVALAYLRHTTPPTPPVKRFSVTVVVSG